MARIILRGTKKKVWYCDYRDENGRRIQRPLSPNQRIAQTLADELEQGRRTKRLGLLPRNLTVDGFKERYFQFVDANKARNTRYKDRMAFKMMESSFPAMRRLSDITPEFLEQLKYKWMEELQKPSIIARYIMSLKTAMRKAEEWKYVAPQDWRTVKVRAPKGRLLYYSMEELMGLLAICKGDWLTAALLMGRAGLRSGEVRHLCFEDIDFRRRALHIRWKECAECRDCVPNGSRWWPKGSKPDNPKERWVDMPEDLEAYLRALPKGSGWLLRPEVRKQQVYEVYFRRLIKNAGLRGSPHTLRHTFASHLASEGVSLQVISELLGHANIKTTQIYAHLMPHARRFGVDKLPKLASKLHPVFASSSVPRQTQREPKS